jgi:predicted oxidoreductase
MTTAEASQKPDPAVVPAAPISPDGPQISAIAAGCWRLLDWRWGPDEVRAWITQCIDLGITTFDHADIYGDYRVNALFGEALAGDPALARQIQIVTKCNIALRSGARPTNRVKHYNSTAGYIRASVEAQLGDLRIDHIDVLLLHRPDPLLDADEVASAGAELQAAGKVRHLGVSNFGVTQLDLLGSRTPLVTNQVEHSLLHTPPLFDGTFDRCQQLRIRPMLWSPLGGGRLFDDHDPHAEQIRHVAQVMAGDYGVSLATLALAWLLAEPARPIPVVSSSRPSGLSDAAAAVRVVLDRQDWFTLLAASTGSEVP